MESLMGQITEATLDKESVPSSDSPARLAERLAAVEQKLADLEERLPEDRVSIVVFSGDLDKVLAAFIIATGAAALGQQVSMFFTFWGLNAVRRKKVTEGKPFFEKLMALMSPADTRDLPLSQMNFFGIGAKMLRAMMQRKQINSLEELIGLARELGVRLVACEMSRDVMGIKDEELIEGLELGGVATFLGDALKSRVTLFV
ncbi:MAG: DsrE/DsrF/DrsH-like family protein [Blastocatellia bacterium]|nr:DsrE/DsrF/DrsH-like family protein [Blastocatellia bacterium]MCS7158216.1 DsrE/DsrF/DrsH-like family protein [Blastocatellia bacterium]MCX7753566.1 DsrE/DsrF/DrsH-like family protein [Blastocatellia bacterium]MDW8169370.1 DsrE/DsrF/DrsH-like family protein [Acidobacteriota bacterium]MDW8255664.1 DsrE/DsrF/DrsH-like family protein [Acidobacteriota bacterium]